MAVHKDCVFDNDHILLAILQIMVKSVRICNDWAYESSAATVQGILINFMFIRSPLEAYQPVTLPFAKKKLRIRKSKKAST